MPPAVISAILFAVEEIVKQSPAIGAELKALFNKADPTPADWAALRAKVQKTYADYVPASAIPQ